MWTYSLDYAIYDLICFQNYSWFLKIFQVFILLSLARISVRKYITKFWSSPGSLSPRKRVIARLFSFILKFRPSLVNYTLHSNYLTTVCFGLYSSNVENKKISTYNTNIMSLVSARHLLAGWFIFCRIDLKTQMSWNLLVGDFTIPRVICQSSSDWVSTLFEKCPKFSAEIFRKILR